MFLNFQTLSVCFLRPTAKIQILMYRNLDFLVKALTSWCLIYFGFNVIIYFSSKNSSYFQSKEIMITPCDPLLKHELFHMCFSTILLTFQEHLFKETPLNGLFRLLQQRGFTRECRCIFPRKTLLPGVFKYENITLQAISRGVLIPLRENLFTKLSTGGVVFSQ